MSDAKRLPIESMLKDADDAWRVHVGTARPVRPDLTGDMACHVRALVAELCKASEACAVAYRHLDTFGVGDADGYIRELESQDQASGALRPWTEDVGGRAVSIYREDSECSTPSTSPAAATAGPPPGPTPPPGETPWRLSPADLADLVAAYVARDEYMREDQQFSEGFLREMLRDLAGMTGDQTRALWFDSIERGLQLVERYQSTRGGPAPGTTGDTPGSSGECPASG